jgi:hypothetical protein
MRDDPKKAGWGTTPLRLERRLSPRRNTNIRAEIAFSGGQRLPCIVKDVSETGARIELASVGKVPNGLVLLVPGHLPQPCRVAWRSLKEMGLEYHE